VKDKRIKKPVNSPITVNTGALTMVIVIRAMLPTATPLLRMEKKKNTKKPMSSHHRQSPSRYFTFEAIALAAVITLTSCSGGQGSGAMGAVGSLFMLPFSLLSSVLGMVMSNPVGTAAAASAFTN
jgi:hypothetical protein